MFLGGPQINKLTDMRSTDSGVPYSHVLFSSQTATTVASLEIESTMRCVALVEFSAVVLHTLV